MTRNTAKLYEYNIVIRLVIGGFCQDEATSIFHPDCPVVRMQLISIRMQLISIRMQLVSVFHSIVVQNINFTYK